MRGRQRARLDLRALLAALFVAALVALVAYAAGSGSPITSTRLPLVGPTRPTPSGGSPTPTHGATQQLDDFWTVVALVVIALIVAVPIVYVLFRLALVLWGITSRNDLVRSRWDEDDLRVSSGAVLPDAEPGEQLAAGVDAGLTELDAGTDPRQAVIDCWVRLEGAAAGVDVARRPEETATDLAVRVLAGARVGRGALDRLLALYHEARYSPHPITPADVDAARSVLAEVRHDLASEKPAVMTTGSSDATVRGRQQ